MQIGLSFSIAFILLFSPGISHAYLDPGTGSMILQGIIAGIAMSAMTIKLYWEKLRNLFRKDSHEDEPEEEDSVEDTPG